MNQNEVGNILKELRVKKGFTQKDIAESLIITPQTVSKWELGVSYPSIDMLIALADLYDVSVDDLIRGDIEKKDVVAIKDGNKTQFQIVLYILYVILLGLGISLLFVDYINVDIRALDASNYFDYWFESDGVEIITIPMKLSNVLMQVLFIGLPLALIVINLIDNKKIFTSLLTLAGFAYIYVMMMAYLNSFFTVSANVGMLLHGIYAFILLLSIVLFVRLTTLPLEEYVEKHKKHFIIAGSLFVLSLLMTLGLHYRVIHSYVLLSLILAIILPLLYPLIANKEYRNWVIMYGFIIGGFLVVTTFESFEKGGMLLPLSGAIYIAVLCYGLISEMRSVKLPLKSEIPLTIVELFSLVCYGYLITSDGDLWFLSVSTNVRDYDTTIRLHNMIFDLGYTAYLSFGLIILLLVIRFLNYKKAHKILYVTFSVIQLGVVMTLFLVYTVYLQYRMTDGLIFYIPPILLLLYYIVHSRLIKRSDS